MPAKSILRVVVGNSVERSISKSPECIVPSAFDTTHRQQSAKVGIFNLISTMIGGGVLSLPFAVAQSGLFLGFLLLTLSAFASIFSFDILVSASRRTGSSTYQQIGYFAFGKNISLLITFLILVLTYLASTGYCVLVGDLLKPIVCYIGSLSEAQCSSEWLRRLVIASGIFLVSPFCYMRQIKALKWTSIMGLVGVSILALIITLTTLQSFGDAHDIYSINKSGQSIKYNISNEIKLFPTSFEDVIYAFPVFGIAFMCHFNIPQVHSELTRPTRLRMRYVLICVVVCCYIIYSFIAFFGYYYSFGYTCGNILLNYNQNSMIVSFARLCLGAVILFTFPLLILPARSNLHNLLNVCFSFQSMNMKGKKIDSADRSRSTSTDVDSNHSGEEVKHNRLNKEVNNIRSVNQNDDRQPLTNSAKSHHQILSYDTFSADISPMRAVRSKGRASQSTSSLLHKGRTRTPSQKYISFTSRSFSNLDSPLRTPADALGVMTNPLDVERLRNEDFVQHFTDLDSAKDFRPSTSWLVIETTVMIGLSLVVSFVTSSVMVVWSIVGSTVTFVIAFTLPALFYMKIRKHKGMTLRNILSMIVAIVSCCAVILCSWQAVMNLDILPCPVQPSSPIYLFNS